MAMLIATLQVMPDSPEQDLEQLTSATKPLIEGFGAKVEGVEEEPVAFGLKALNIRISVDESKGDLEPLEQKLSDIAGVQSVRVTAVSRTMG